MTSAASPGRAAVTVRPAAPGDHDGWRVLRGQLWPEADAAEHDAVCARYFATGAAPGLEAVLVAEQGSALVGFAELSIRQFVDGCRGEGVGYLEGWFVIEAVRGRGVGRALVAAAEGWARARGCAEFASDTDVDDDAAAAAHRALGFVETAAVRLFRKPL